MHQIKQTVYKGIAILSLAMMSASSAHAAFVSMDHDVFGKNMLVQDTSTGLQWLKLRHVNGGSLNPVLSYDQMINEMGHGGKYEGFRYATIDEVFQLAEGVGFDFSGLTSEKQANGHISWSTDYSAENSDPVKQLMWSLGWTGDLNAGLRRSIGGVTASTQEDGSHLFAEFAVCLKEDAIFCVNSKDKGKFYMYDADDGQIKYAASHWLIWEGKGTPPSPVPEPGTYSMLLLGLGMVGIAVRRRKRSIQ